MRDLIQGDKGTDVTFAQRLYNKFSVENGFQIYLTTDGDFGPTTHKAITAFQTWYNNRYGAFLPKNGVVGGSTWQALGAAQGASHKVNLVAQYSNTTCWEACMNMILGRNMCREMPAGMLASNRLLLDSRHILQTYASMMNRTLVNAPRTIQALRSLVQRRPIVLLGRGGHYAGSGHAVVISAVWADKTQSEELAVVRVLNPSPVNRGRIEPSTYPLMECERNNFLPLWVCA